MGVLVRGVGEAYAALVSGREARFAPMRIQFADYASWQRRELAGSEDDHDDHQDDEQLLPTQTEHGFPPGAGLPRRRPGRADPRVGVTIH